MSPLLDKAKIKLSLLAVGLVLFGILGLISWRPELFYFVFPVETYLFMHTIFEFSSIIIGISVFLIVWYSWPQTHNGRDLVIGISFLAVGLFEWAHILACNGIADSFLINRENQTAAFALASRFFAAAGLFFAAFTPRRGRYRPSDRLHFTCSGIGVAAGVMLVILGFSNYLPTMYRHGQPDGAFLVGVESVIVGLHIAALYRFARRSPGEQHVCQLRTALVCSLAGEIAVMGFGTGGHDSYELLGSLYRLGAYCFVLKALFGTSVLHPYIRISRLARSLRNLSVRNAKLYKEAQNNHQLLKETLVQLGAMVASKNNLEEMLEQVIRSAAAVFKCDHAYLALAEGEPARLKLVAYISSFKPPAELLPDQSLLGEVFASRQAIVIDSFAQAPKKVAHALDAAGLHSMVGAPIRHNGDIIGAIGLFSRRFGNFTDSDAALLTVFSHQAGEAIKNARFFAHTVQSLNDLRVLYDIVKEIAVQLSPSDLLCQVTMKLQSLFQADGAVAFIMHHRDDGLHTEKVFSENFTDGEIKNLGKVFSDNKTSWPWGDLEESLVTMSILNQRRLHIMPLISGGILQGLLVFSWKDPKIEIPSGLEIILSTIARQSAVGLERAYLYDSIREMALTDALTRLPNRRQFDSCLTKEFNRAVVYRRPITLVMLDIDFFKKVNDTWGHLAGDAILQQLGTKIKSLFRNTDFPARYGGEEFAVILPETAEAQAWELAEHFRLQIAAESFQVEDNCIKITVSLGLATVSDDMLGKMTATRLLEAADQALYEAKQSGRNRVVAWQKNA
ncbi:diguanylate cyclase [Propionispora vibrioides]|uniref:Diguanylate cyclase (GGDEF) domain-containing protein n=1 Tax=Propionispora vibrioides TaxID=112903 RepID=A0A1H8XCA9_9FIRM|nr:diguanylate cyclase [Propionispora vibrioides]SEP37556.1 diguanylate cyclase (GGDEF) domain-containing protein [Propionispora vibrioides]